MIYEINETSSEKLCYVFIEAYEDCLNRDDFLERTKDLCPDLGILNAIFDLIDLLTLGGR